MQWIDDEGRTQREVGEGNLIFIRPGRVALTFRKLGEVYLWFGADEEHFWMFQGGDDRRAWVGRTENAFAPCAESLPVPVHPSELIDLYGIFELPEATERFAAPNSPPRPLTPTFDESRGAWVIETPGHWSDRRLFLDPSNWLPMRVELVERRSGQVLAEADLSDYAHMTVRGLPPGLHPLVPTRMVVRSGAAPEEGHVRISVASPADRRPGHTGIRAELFQFNAVRSSMRPREVVVLDERCSRPAAVGGE